MLQFKLIRANVLKKVVLSLEKLGLGDIATLHFTKAGLLLQNSEAYPPVVGVCQLYPQDCDYFYCNVVALGGVNLHSLASILNTAADDEEEELLVGISKEGNITINFCSKDTNGQRRYRNYATYAIGQPNNHVDIDDREYEYEVIVGIPSDEFRVIYESLSRGSADRVHVLITDEEVEFNTGRGKPHIILEKERNECVIGGAKEDTGLYTIEIRLNHMYSFLDASELSKTVWLLWSPDAPSMLTCHLTNFHLGDFRFYFLKEDYTQIDSLNTNVRLY